MPKSLLLQAHFVKIELPVFGLTMAQAIPLQAQSIRIARAQRDANG